MSRRIARDSAAAVKIRLRTAEGEACIGSGRVVAPGVVLTALHVLRHLGSADDSSRLRVRSSQGSFGVIETAGMGSLDAAVLFAPGLEGPPGRTIGGNLRRSGPLERCAIIGFPEAGKTGGRLVPEYLEATVLPRLEEGDPRLVLAVGTPLPIDPTAWQGLSGAGIIAPEGQLLGIVTHVPLLWEGRLHAVAIDRIVEAATETGATRLADLALVDIDDDDALIRAPERQRVADLADYSPLELLHYRNRVVPFIEAGSLTGTVRRVLDWVRSTRTRADDRGPDVSVMVLTGPAGTGKSRLAAEICERISADDRRWRAGFVDYERLATAPLPSVPLLAVCDYSERHPDLIGSFIDHAVRAQRAGTLQAPVRLILASRSTGEWLERIHDQAPGLNQAIGIEVDLGIDSFGSGDRRVHAERALAAFWERLGRPSAPPPPDLLRFDRPLTIHMGALMMALGEEPSGHGELEDRQEALLRQLMRREGRRWTDYRNAAGEPVLGGLNRAFEVLCVSTLTAPQKNHLPQLLRSVPALADAPGERLADIADAFHDLYPSNLGGAQRIAPVEPDLIAAHLLATTSDRSEMVKALVDSPVLHRWPEYHARLMHILLLTSETYPEVQQDLKDHLASSLSALTGAEERTGIAELVEKNLSQLVRITVEAAMSSGDLTGAKHLEFALGLVQIDETAAIRALALLTGDAVPRFNPSLSGLGAALAEAATNCWRAQPARANERYPQAVGAATSRLADAENELGSWKDLTGFFEEGLAARQRAVRLYERLAEEDESYIGQLAGVIHNCALAESRQVDEAEAVRLLRRAIDLWQHCHEHLVGDYRADLALAKANLGRFLIDVGRHGEALRNARQAVRTSEELCAEEPEQYRALLSRAVFVEAMTWSACDRRSEGVDAAERAVDLAEDLVRSDRSEFLPVLVRSINLLADCLEVAGRPRESLEQRRRQARLCRGAYQSRPEVWGPEVVAADTEMAGFFERTGRVQEALEATDRAIETGERLVRIDRTDYLETLAMALDAAVLVRLALNTDLTNGLHLVDRLERIGEELAEEQDHRSYGGELKRLRADRREFHRRLTGSGGDALGSTP